MDCCCIKIISWRIFSLQDSFWILAACLLGFLLLLIFMWVIEGEYFEHGVLVSGDEDVWTSYVFVSDWSRLLHWATKYMAFVIYFLQPRSKCRCSHKFWGAWFSTLARCRKGSYAGHSSHCAIRVQGWKLQYQTSCLRVFRCAWQYLMFLIF